MAKNLTFRYAKIGDILYVDTCTPYAEQESEELGEEKTCWDITKKITEMLTQLEFQAFLPEIIETLT